MGRTFKKHQYLSIKFFRFMHIHGKYCTHTWSMYANLPSPKGEISLSFRNTMARVQTNFGQSSFRAFYAIKI